MQGGLHDSISAIFDIGQRQQSTIAEAEEEAKCLDAYA
jgi:hypothetical protein